MHGYSLLRTQLNQGYFHDLFNESLKFGVDIEGHRTSERLSMHILADEYVNSIRYGDRTRHILSSASLDLNQLNYLQVSLKLP